MLKTIIALCACYAFVGAIPEPDLTTEYPLAPYDRCMSAYEGTAAQGQCGELKVEG